MCIRDSNPGFPLDPPFTFKPGALVFDLIYSPRKTLFLEAAQSFNAVTENGLIMLLAQAAESYQIWTGKPFPLEPVSYTHLRAHETVLDLVCRLLRETKNRLYQNNTINY